MNLPTPPAAQQRLDRISEARRAVLHSGSALSRPGDSGVAPWIEQSWQRCLALGLRPQDNVSFNAVSKEAMRRGADENRLLLEAARPVLGQLAHAMAHTRYFAILTDAQGVVVEVDGPIDRDDRRASLITRLGVDLSEAAVGTTAIGAALREQQPVWLHRGEHFFADTSVYSCAGAPVFGPAGQCVGMLDLTGVDVPERPELRHLVAQCARRIENRLLGHQPAAMVARLRWPDLDAADSAGRVFQPSDTDGLLSLDRDGYVIGSNAVARQMVPQIEALASIEARRAHCSELFAMPWEHLFDAMLLGSAALEVPLWSGLRLQVWPTAAGAAAPAAVAALANRSPAEGSLRDVEISLIRKAVDQARGNVTVAARKLGISRATVYRKLRAVTR